jgi:hypothetical protein
MRQQLIFVVKWAIMQHILASTVVELTRIVQ